MNLMLLVGAKIVRFQSTYDLIANWESSPIRRMLHERSPFQKWKMQEEKKLVRANNLLGSQIYNWPNRQRDFNPTQREAWRLRQSLLNDGADQMIKETPYLNDYICKAGIRQIFYDPKHFANSRNEFVRRAAALTEGWIDEPINTPWIRMGDPAFKDMAKVNLVLGHEVMHVVQRHNPEFYRGRNERDGFYTREWDVHRRQIELRNNPGIFQLTSSQKVDMIKRGDFYLERARQEAYWTNLARDPNKGQSLQGLVNRWQRAKQSAFCEVTQDPEYWGILDLPWNRANMRSEPFRIETSVGFHV